MFFRKFYSGGWIITYNSGSIKVSKKAFNYCNLIGYRGNFQIIIIFNIITILERSAYQYYVKVCIEKNYLEIYSDPYFLETKGTQEESSLNSNLIIDLKDDSSITNNESSVEFNFCEKTRINNSQFSKNRGYCCSIDELHNSSKKNNRHKINLFIFQNFSTNTLTNYHLPSKNNSFFSHSNENIQQEEGI